MPSGKPLILNDTASEPARSRCIAHQVMQLHHR